MIEPSVYEQIFHDCFLENAPLYRNCKKVKLPYEDLKTTATLYHGSLKDEMRTVEQIADYRLLKNPEDPKELASLTRELACHAGILVDGLIRMENGRKRDGSDVLNVSNTAVINVFEHFDGRRNLNFMVVDGRRIHSTDPANILTGWIAYRFYFAVAKV